MEIYDSTNDPIDHLESFKTFKHLQGIPNEIMRWDFPTTCKGLARLWFSKVKSSFISTIKELSNDFITYFIGGQRHKCSTRVNAIKQREDESLKSYVARFNMEALLIDEAGEMVLVTGFSSGLKEGEFIRVWSSWSLAFLCYLILPKHIVRAIKLDINKIWNVG